jgi:hypothetical protein
VNDSAIIAGNDTFIDHFGDGGYVVLYGSDNHMRQRGDNGIAIIEGTGQNNYIDVGFSPANNVLGFPVGDNNLIIDHGTNTSLDVTGTHETIIELGSYVLANSYGSDNVFYDYGTGGSLNLYGQHNLAYIYGDNTSATIGISSANTDVYLLGTNDVGVNNSYPWINSHIY